MKAIKFLIIPILVLFILGCSNDNSTDTTAPVINISFTDPSNTSNSAPIIVDDELRFTITTAESDNVAKVEVFINDEKVAEDTSAPFDFVINVSSFSSKTGKSLKNYILKVIATDTSGNQTTIEQPINIPKKLITVNFPADEVNPERSQFYVFASGMDGKLLAIEELGANETSVTLYSGTDIPNDLEYMLTFAEKNDAAYGETNELTTIQNISYATLKEINIKARPRFSSDPSSKNYPDEFPIQGFWENNTTEFSFINGYGLDFSTSTSSCNCPFDPNNPPSDSSITINTFEPMGSGFKKDKVYLQFVNTAQKTADYVLLNRETLQDGFVLTRDLFGTTGMSLEQFTFPNLNLAISRQPWLYMYAYDSDVNYSNNNFYKIEPYNFIENDRTVTNYWFNTNFEHYITNIKYLQYGIKHIGQPYATYMGKDWTLSYTFDSGLFTLEKNTNDADFVGTIFMSDDFYNDQGGSNIMLNGREGTYRWGILFNSQNINVISLPEIPEEIQNWVFHNKYLNEPIGTINERGQRKIELIRYEGLNSYEDYLQQVVKDNEKWYLVAPVRESVFYNPSVWDNPVNGFRFPFD